MLNSPSQTQLSAKNNALQRAAQILKSRIRFNYTLRNQLCKMDTEDALCFISNHFFEGNDPARHLIYEISGKKQQQQVIQQYQEACLADATNFEFIEYCFEFDNLDYALTELWIKLNFLLRFEKRQCEVSERPHIERMRAIITPYLDKELLLFMLSARVVVEEMGPDNQIIHTNSIQLEKLEPIFMKSEELLIYLLQHHRSHHHQLAALSKKAYRVYEDISFSEAELARILHAGYQMQKIVAQYEPIEELAGEIARIRAELEAKTNPPRVVLQPVVIPAENQVAAPACPAIDAEPTITPDLVEQTIADVPEEVYVPNFAQYKQKENRKKNMVHADTPEEKSPQAQRLGHYAGLLARKKDLLFDMFAPSTPHLIIQWTEIKKIFTLVGIQMCPGAGSRATLKINENLPDEQWAEILEPMKFSRRGIHVQHPGKDLSEKLARNYLEIIIEALDTLGLNPKQLWPEDPRTTKEIARRYKR